MRLLYVLLPTLSFSPCWLWCPPFSWPCFSVSVAPATVSPWLLDRTPLCSSSYVLSALEATAENLIAKNKILFIKLETIIAIHKCMHFAHFKCACVCTASSGIDGHTQGSRCVCVCVPGGKSHHHQRFQGRSHGGVCLLAHHSSLLLQCSHWLHCY